MAGNIVDGRYELIEVVASGGMATVWRARDLRLGREVALKRPHPTSEGDPIRTRFEREARLAAGLSHPNVVTVHDTGVDEEGPYLVMELLDAPNLAQRTLEPDEAIRVGAAVADALAAIHAAGIIHRDIKPANVILARSGPQLTDFGIAHDPSSTGALTLPHQVLATPGYAAPEILAGRPATPAADIFSLGALIYEMVARRPAFPATVGAVRRPPPALGIPDLDALLHRCLDDDPRERPAAADVASALRRGGMPTMAMPVFAPPTDGPPTMALGAEGSDRSDPTVAYSPPPRQVDEEPPSPPVGGGARWVMAIALVALTVALAVAAAAFIDGDAPTAGATTTAPPADTTTTVPEPTTTAPETTTSQPETTTTAPETTTTTEPSTTTTQPSTTTASGDSVVNARDGFLELLDAMPREMLGGREVRDIADDVDQAMEAYGAGDVEETRNELEEIGNQIEHVRDDDAGRQLLDGFVRLAEAMGFEVQVEG